MSLVSHRRNGVRKEFHIMKYLNCCETELGWFQNPLFWFEKMIKNCKKIIMGYNLYS